MAKRNKRRHNISLAERRAFILHFMHEQPSRNFTLQHLASASGGGKEGARHTAQILKELIEERVVEKSHRHYSLAMDHLPHYEGKIVIASSGTVCVDIEGFSNVIHVPQNHSHTALDGDTVECVINNRSNRKGQEAIVTRIIRRSPKVYTGVTELRSSNVICVRTDHRKIPTDICLLRKDYPDMEENKRVAVRITGWEDERLLPTGVLVAMLGDAGDNEAEIHAIMSEFDLPFRFPEEVERAAAEIPARITEEDYAERRDMRSVPTFTIDPDEAKDFDDALSVRRTGEDEWEVGIHIADVSHYVLPGSVLDAEAQSRGTSVYLVDRVVPMLPERLSNELCSLRPNEEKLCFSAIFTIGEDLTIRSEWFGRTVILSDRRFTYGEAQQVIESGEGDMAEEITVLNRLAKGLRSRRVADGALLFDRREAYFRLDDKGRPIGIGYKESKEANHLIEEFMLLANRCVAAYCGKTRSGRARTMVYRVHDKPDPEKLDKFRSFVARYGLRLREGSGKSVNRDLNSILERTRNLPEESTVAMMAIRSMAKAVYSTDNIGHYGLAFRHYTHFTSPIRRYPDILAHRLLARYLEGGRTADREELEALCVHSSERETVATEAERASIKYKIAEYMQGRTEIFEGHIVSFKEWGMFVELEDSVVEGAVRFADMGDDYYRYDSESFSVTGTMSGRTFTLGDKVRVKVLTADIHRRVLDFKLVD